ncbi:MAG TPA: regulatory protein RecX [Candidatus Omnitrophota bacterium]|nr:regulatory protein RecX [Candidatus Omnitrophota bacterium]HQL41611.1 regulatory protein RecX [Candidatus Omnitrophota bacterium]
MTVPRDNDILLQKGKTYCFRLLRIRQRSQAEIAQRLKQKRYPSKIINKLVQYLKTLELINDQQFARDWIKMRLFKGLGRHRIRCELRQKGISDTIIVKTLSECLKSVDEAGVVEQIANKRLARYKNLEPSVLKRRLYGYLMRRGFEESLVLQSIQVIDHDHD